MTDTIACAPRAPTWPDAARWRAWARFQLLFYVLFFPLYFGAAALAERSGRALRLYADWELGVPLIAPAILPYLGIVWLYLAPAFQMTPEEIARLSRQASATIIGAFVVFLAAPSRTGYPPVDVAQPWAAIYALTERAVGGAYNAFPSLHVAFAWLLMEGCADVATLSVRRVYRLVFALAATSTVLAHQHHLADVAGGVALAALVRWSLPICGDRPTSR